MSRWRPFYITLGPELKWFPHFRPTNVKTASHTNIRSKARRKRVLPCQDRQNWPSLKDSSLNRILDRKFRHIWFPSPIQDSRRRRDIIIIFTFTFWIPLTALVPLITFVSSTTVAPLTPRVPLTSPVPWMTLIPLTLVLPTTLIQEFIILFQRIIRVRVHTNVVPFIIKPLIIFHRYFDTTSFCIRDLYERECQFWDGQWHGEWTVRRFHKLEVTCDPSTLLDNYKPKLRI